MEKSIVIVGELRAESEGAEFALAGYAALYNRQSKNLGGFKETVAPGAFDRSLASKALVRFTFNHSQDAVLARTDNGTLTLASDAKGLRFKAQLNKKIQSHQDLWEACKAGLYNECSFAFICAPDGQQWSADRSQRTLTDVDLLDCSLVGTPAYEGTSASARSTASVGTDDLLARLLAMPGDWARQERANAFGLEIIASRGAASDTDEEEDGDGGLDDLRDALHDHFGKADHGLTPRYWPIEQKKNAVVCCDMNARELPCCSIPYSCDEDGNYTFGDPEETDYSATGRAAKNIHEARTARADGECKKRMRAEAGR